ncbi:hypothetical protein IL306_015130 [Fusarium sp. DS 682]|nr:hypothetical protein IL306_015130 [Fusarium sp. DS 682]
MEEYSSEDITDSDWGDDADDLDTRFDAAAAAMVNSRHSLSEPQALYDFLYKFRDVIGMVNEDSETLLHVALRVTKADKDSGKSNMVPLIQSIVKEHPQLLTIKNHEGMTPLYMAISIRKPLLVGAMLSGCVEYAEWQSAVQDAIEIPCAQQNNKCCLHIAFESAIREKLVVKLMNIARNEALSMQDDGGMTPLHHAMQTSKPSLDVVRLFIERDKMILKMQEASSITHPVETFLDIINKEGNSVYRHHVVATSSAREKEDRLNRYQKRRLKPTLESNAQVTDPKGEGDEKSNQGHEAPVALGFDPLPEKEQGKERKRKQATEEWKEILKELKLHYMRTRNVIVVESFLYGKNIDDIQLCFDYHGLPAKVKDTDFTLSFSSLKFDEILQFVSFPNLKVERTGGRRLLQETQKGGKGCRDMLFFFDWLHSKGVRYIIRVDVEDSRELPHSDQAILESLVKIQVEHLNWQKVDLDPQVICEVGSLATWAKDTSDLAPASRSQIREVTLLWSGNNTTLRAWSEPEGLLLLPKLRKINILVPPGDEMIESPESVSAFIGDFRHRITKNALARDEIAGEGQNDNVSKERVSSATESHKRNLEISFLQTRGKGKDREALETSSQARASVESRAGHRWLDAVYGFADVIKPIWHRLHDSVKIDDSSTVADDIVVALIDDGVDAYGASISENIIGGRSLAVNYADNIVAPWYVSRLGHGTIMAQAITRVCPMVKLYPMSVKIMISETGKHDIELKSVALAVQAAIDRKANIILIPFLFETDHPDMNFLDMELQRACKEGILIFCPSADRGDLQDSSPFRLDTIFRIGEARDDGSIFVPFGSLSSTDFIFPGNQVILQHDVNNSQSSNESTLDEISGPSVSATLAAGLAAMLIYSTKVILLKSMEQARGLNLAIGGKGHSFQLTSLQRRQGMMKAFQSLGSVTDSRFLKVWETLEPIIKEIKDSPVEDPDLRRLNGWFSQLEL